MRRKNVENPPDGSLTSGRREFLGSALLAGAAISLTSVNNPLRALPQGNRPSSPGKLRKVRDLDLLLDDHSYLGPGPSPVIFPDGEILLALRRAPAKNQSHGFLESENCVMSSKDNGSTWGEVRVNDFSGVHNVNLTLLKDGTLLQVTPVATALTPGAYDRVKDLPPNSLPTRGYRLAQPPNENMPASMFLGTRFRRSKDRGLTWGPGHWISPPIPEVPPLLPGFPTPLHNRSRIVELRSGKLIIPVYSFPNPWRLFLAESNDGGFTWSLTGRIAGPEDGDEVHKSGLVDGKPAFNETYVHETVSGRLVAFVRLHAGATERTRSDWPGRSNPVGHLWTASSDDGGRTWTKPKRHETWGYPFSTVGMRDGRVLLAYGYRQEPFGVRARLLDPECRQIDEAEELIVRDDGVNRDLGYPQGALMNDGRVFLAYYFNNRANFGGGQKYLAATILEAV